MAQEFANRFYHSRQWKTARQEALRRDGYCCQICGGHAEEVHHIIELNSINVHDPNIALNVKNLQSLCHNCHTLLTHEEHGHSVSDIGVGYYFDNNGMLQRYDTAPVP